MARNICVTAAGVFRFASHAVHATAVRCDVDRRHHWCSDTTYRRHCCLLLRMGRADRPGVAHLLIVESRTLFIVLITVLPLVTYFYRVRFAFSIVGLIVASSLVLLPLLEAGDKALELTFGAFEGTSEDQSLTERLEAMQIGLGLMFDNPALGVGPGNSAKVHIYTSAHQYWINQGEEIGVLGLILSVALSVAVFWRFFSCIQARSIGTFRDRGFPGIAGAAGYMLYGCMANMALSSTVVNAWIGLFAIMLALDSVRFSDLQDHRQGVGVGRVEQ